MKQFLRDFGVKLIFFEREFNFENFGNWKQKMKIWGQIQIWKAWEKMDIETFFLFTSMGFYFI